MLYPEGFYLILFNCVKQCSKGDNQQETCLDSSHHILIRKQSRECLEHSFSHYASNSCTYP